jgi:hypothetical protein
VASSEHREKKEVQRKKEDSGSKLGSGYDFLNPRGLDPVSPNRLAQEQTKNTKKRRRSQPGSVPGIFCGFPPKSRRPDGDPRLILVQVQFLASPEMPSQVMKDLPP